LVTYPLVLVDGLPEDALVGFGLGLLLHNLELGFVEVDVWPRRLLVNLLSPEWSALCHELI
jgi:hypothetical protein